MYGRCFGGPKRLSALAAPIVFVAAVAGCPAIAGAQDALFDEAVEFFQRGMTEEAKQKFEEVLAQNPSNDEALALYHRVNEEIWLRMLIMEDDKAFQAIAQRFSELARKGRKEKSSDQDAIRGLVDEIVNGDFQAQRNATFTLGANHGTYAVGEMWSYLGDDSSETRVRIIMALTQLGSDAVMPLIAVLASDDDRIQANAAAVLGTIGDSRAVPALRAVAESGGSLAKSQAAAALEKIGGSNSWTDFARNALLGRSSAVKPYEAAYVVWTFDGELTGRDVSPGLYQLELAEQACYAALAQNVNNEEALSLLAATYASQIAEVKASQAAGEGEGDADEALADLTVALAACGEAGMNGGLALLANETGHGLGAGVLAEALGALPANDRSGLETALGSSDKNVRYSAAFGLLAAGSKSRDVIAALGEAASEASIRQALVIDGDSGSANTLTEGLRGAGYNVITASDGSRGLDFAKQFPPKDVVIANTATSGVTVDAIVRNITQDARTSSVPIILLAPSGDVDRYDQLFSGQVQGVVPSPADWSIVGPAVEGAIGDLNSARQAAHDISVRASQALATLSAGDLSPAVAHLVAVVKDASRSSDVKVPCLAALAKLQNTEALDAVSELFNDTSAESEVRVAAANAMAGIFSNASLQSANASVVDGLTSALGEDDNAVRAAAARALGAAGFLTAEQRAEVLRANRVN